MTTNDIYNEHVKLLAATVNNLALAMIIGAVIAPAVSGTLQGGRHVAVILV
jgi:hypothetical protein